MPNAGVISGIGIGMEKFASNFLAAHQAFEGMKLKKEDHKRINHGGIDFQDWSSGIKQLRNQLKMKDSDFPQHIQEEIKKRKEQKRLK